MANVNNSFLVNLSQAIGISYDLKRNVLGSSANPNSALFNISQIASIITNGRPNFGVYDDDNSFTTINFSNNNNQSNFEFSPGIVFFQTSLRNIPSQTISAKSENDQAGKKLFKFYLDYNDFILSSQVFTATITEISSTLITVNQLPNFNYLQNFSSISINNFIFGVIGINANTNQILLNQDVTNYAFVGSTVTLIYVPLIKYVSTFALSGEPPDIEIPSSGVNLAAAVVEITGSFGALTYSCPLGVEKTFEPYPAYSNPVNFFPNTASYNAFSRSINNSIVAYQQIQNYDIEASLANSFENYTNSISNDVISFDLYWSTRPFTPTGLFQYGLGFDGLQKTDFDPRFKDFWYFFKGVDLTRTYAVFRGDIYGGNAYVGQSLGAYPGNGSVNSYIDFTGNSTLTNGTYSYGVSAVTPAGEYAPDFNSDANFYFNRNVNNYSNFGFPTSYGTPLFFHIYKNIKNGTGFEQQRITNPFEVTGTTLNDTILANNSTTPLGVSSNYFAFKIKNSDTTSGVMGGIGFNAYILDNSALTGIQSVLISSPGANYISPYVSITGNGFGANISLTTSAGGGINSALVISFGSGYTYLPTLTIFDAVTNSGGAGASLTPILSQLSCGIYTGNSTQPLGASVAELQSIPIASISSSYFMNMPVDGNFVGLNSNTNYWALFNMNVPYSLNSNQKLKFRTSAGFSTNFATSSNKNTWNTNVTSNSQIAKLGYVDQGTTGTVTSSRGVKITGAQTAYPCRLYIYVPNLDLTPLTYNDVGPNLQTDNGTIISTSPIQNSMIISVLAENTVTGFQTTLTGNLLKGTARNSAILLGDETSLFDKVIDVFVAPDLNSGVSYVSNTAEINWTIYDLFTINSLP